MFISRPLYWCENWILLIGGLREGNLKYGYSSIFTLVNDLLYNMLSYINMGILYLGMTTLIPISTSMCFNLYKLLFSVMFFVTLIIWAKKANIYMLCCCNLVFFIATPSTKLPATSYLNPMKAQLKPKTLAPTSQVWTSWALGHLQIKWL